MNKFVRIGILLAVVGLLFLSFMANSQTKLVIALSAFEPWTIIDGEKVSGIDIELIEKLAEMQQLEPVYYACPWARCLQLLRTGEIDLVSFVFHSPERAQYLDYIEQPYVHGNYQAFYLNRNTQLQINQFSDLLPLHIGVRRDISYFPRFDQNSVIKKKQVTYDLQLIKMLNSNHIDALVGQEEVIDYLLLKNGFNQQIVKANYKVFQVDNAFLAFSKKSKVRHLKAEMEANLHRLLAQDLIGKLRKKYQ